MTNPDRGEHQQLMATIAGNIRSCRRKLGWSQEELGNRSGLSLKAIGEIERGNRAVSVKSLFQIAKALNVTPSELLTSSPKADPLEDRLRKFVLQARQAKVSPRFVDLCTEFIQEVRKDGVVRSPELVLNNEHDEQHLPTPTPTPVPVPALARSGNGNGHGNGNGNGHGKQLVGAGAGSGPSFHTSHPNAQYPHRS